MTDLYDIKKNTRQFRDALVRDLDEAVRQQELAEQRVKQCRQKLRAFDNAFLSPGDPTGAATGATAAVKRAIIVQQGAEFTPAQLKKTIDEIFPNDALLFPDLQSITRILAKLTFGGHLERIVQGAGLKSPIYRAISEKHPWRKSHHAEKPIQRTASASRLLPD